MWHSNPTARLLVVLSAFFSFSPASEALASDRPTPYLTGPVRWYHWPVADGGTDHWYGILLISLNAFQEESLLERWNLNLVSLGTIEEWAFVSNTVKLEPFSTTFRTGLSAAPGEPFAWSDGTPMNLLLPEGNTNTSSVPLRIHITPWGALQTVADQPSSNTFSAALLESVAHPSELPPAIVRPPAGGSFYNDRPASFSVLAVGGEPISYQWNVGGIPIPNATNTTFQMALTTLSTGAVSIVVSNSAGTIESPPAPITIVPSVATGTNSWWFQWRAEHGGNGHWYGMRQNYQRPLSWSAAINLAQRLGAHLPTLDTEQEATRVIGALHANFVEAWLGLTDAQSEGSFEWVDQSSGPFTSWAATEPASANPDHDYVFTDRDGTWRTAGPQVALPVTLFESPVSPAERAPVFLDDTAPGPFRISLGSTNRIAFDVFGAHLQYQWRLNGQPLRHATNLVLAFNTSSTNETGSYDLIARNSRGAATSPPVSVTVFLPEPITPIISRPSPSTFHIEYNFPADAEMVTLEYSYDLTNWFQGASATWQGPSYNYLFDVAFNPTALQRFFRLRREP